MSAYNRLNQGWIDALRRIVGDSRILHGDDDRLDVYSHDESGTMYAVPPEAVVKPVNASEVSTILRLASERGIPVTTRGAGTGLAGGAVPVYGGIVLSCEKLTKILEIDEQDMFAVVESGVITNDLCKAVDDVGLFYAGYPMSVESSCIGGNVACNAGGAKVVKYGSTGAHVMGLEAVLASGEIISTGGRRKKDSSGYSLKSFFVGSEGTLGVLTEITLNLLPKPGATADLLVPFARLSDAISTVPRVIKAAHTLPTAVEFMDRPSIEYCSSYTNSVLPIREDSEACLIFQFDGRTSDELQDTYELAGQACLDGGALEVFVADNRLMSEKIWAMRRNWLEALKAVDPCVGTGDFVVPPSRIPEMIERIRCLEREYGMTIPCAGHAADGNLHPAVLRPDDRPLLEWKPRMEEILNRIAIEAASLGGAVSGEHGVGFLKKAVLARTKQKELPLMRRIKGTFDPRGILNPGKLFQ